MLCPLCSNEIKDESKFCGKCGKKIPRCPTCGTVIRKRTRFCVHDGTAIPEDILVLFPAPESSVQPQEPTAPEPDLSDTLVAAEISAQIADMMGSAGEPVPEPVAETVIPAQVPPAQPPRRRFCTRCGFPYPDGSTFCPNCSVEPLPPVADPPRPKHFCIKCGKPCEPNQKLCSACRTKIAGEPPRDEKKKKKSPVLLIILIILLIAALVTVGVMAYLIWGPHSRNTDPVSESTGISSGYEDGETESVTDAVTEEPTSSVTEEVTEATEPETEPTEPVTEPPVITYESRYEVITDDVSWQEAKLACEASGGTLATITSEEEYNEICALADSSDLTYIWLGACLYSDADEWANATWVTGEAWTFDNWYPGEPSKQDSDGTKEYYLCMWNVKYSGSEIGWTFNDQRNDIVGSFPSVSGKIGYICEYKVEVVG